MDDPSHESQRDNSGTRSRTGTPHLDRKARVPDPFEGFYVLLKSDRFDITAELSELAMLVD